MCTDSTKKLNWPLQPKFKAQLENWLENIGFKDLKKRPENLKSLIFAFFLFILQYRLQKKPCRLQPCLKVVLIAEAATAEELMYWLYRHVHLCVCCFDSFFSSSLYYFGHFKSPGLIDWLVIDWTEKPATDTDCS